MQYDCDGLPADLPVDTPLLIYAKWDDPESGYRTCWAVARATPIHGGPGRLLAVMAAPYVTAVSRTVQTWMPAPIAPDVEVE